MNRGGFALEMAMPTSGDGRNVACVESNQVAATRWSVWRVWDDVAAIKKRTPERARDSTVLALSQYLFEFGTRHRFASSLAMPTPCWNLVKYSIVNLGGPQNGSATSD
jgi:hypothetical protein